MHWFKLFESLVHMITSLAAEGHLKFTQGVSKLMLISTNKFRAFLSVQKEVELGDWLDLESLSCFTIVIALDCAEHNVLVLISSTIGLKSWLEAHARAASWRPEINDYSCICANNCLELNKGRYLTNFTKLWRGCCIQGLSRLGALASILLLLLHSLYHSSHLRVTLYHLLHLWIVLKRLQELGVLHHLL